MDTKQNKIDLSVIITAGGIGKRMNSKIPKQFLLIDNQPILMKTISLFTEYQNTEIILTLPTDWWVYWNELCEKFNFKVPHQLVAGGEERFDSIKNALIHAQGEIVAIHDAVRPFVSKQTIENCLKLTKEKGNAIPTITIPFSLRKGDENKSESVNRSDFFNVQTPQFFKTEMIKKAYNQPYQSIFTDDASVVESIGQNIYLSAGNEENIKITTPLDLEIATLINQKFTQK